MRVDLLHNVIISALIFNACGVPQKTSRDSSFLWDSSQSSSEDVPLLNLATLRLCPGHKERCIFRGYLLNEVRGQVAIVGTWDFEDSFEVGAL